MAIKKLKEEIINKKGMDDYSDLMEMSYNEIVDFLKKKYGEADCDYFTNETCKVKSKNISRTKEGLFCHHIDEDKAIMLSKPEFAVNNPFEYQKADRLVYCNFLEHLLLHILIAEECRNAKANDRELPGIGGAINFIVPELNMLYSGYEPKLQWKINIWDKVKDDYETYLYMLKRLVDLFKNDIRYDNIFEEKMIFLDSTSCEIEEVLSLDSEHNLCQKIYNDLVNLK